MDDQYSGNEIAIIGIAGCYPSAPNVQEFWRALSTGQELIKHFTDEELENRGVSRETLANPNYIKAACVLDDMDMFDAPFFGIPPNEARLIDPQHRHFLQCAWHVLEDGAYVAEDYDGLIGVYAGSGMNSYMLKNIVTNQGAMDFEDHTQFLITNDKDYLATRVSYKLNLHGPSYTVQSACSTSLVAVHQACQSLLNLECDMCLAGGASVQALNTNGYKYIPGGPFSADGYCRPFDSEANGTVFGSGVGVVLLKRLDDAIDDNDHIYAMIKGSAVNNDGSRKAGYTAPSVAGLSEVVVDALDNADVDAKTIGFVEAHGTGTELGDPIEIAALSKVFSTDADDKKYCAIGSVKSTVGHLDAAAGVTGLIKTALSLYHNSIPPNVNFTKPNPKLNLENSPFFINTGAESFQNFDHPKRACVNAMGIGGTNSFVVLEQAPVRTPSESSTNTKILLCSGKTKEALERVTENLAEYLLSNENVNLADIAYTLQIGRKHFQHRSAIVCEDQIEGAKKLTNNMSSIVGAVGKESCCVAFMFPGQGNQYINMAKDIYEKEPVFQTEFDRCVNILSSHIDCDLSEIIFPLQGNMIKDHSDLDKTAYAQPALFVVEYALAQLWMSWGIYPTVMLGHSIGEYVAACLSGVWSLEDTLYLVAERGRLMQEMPAGDMMSVALDEQALKPLLDDSISIAAINTFNATVVSGPASNITNLHDQLTEQGVRCVPLRTSHAFHSSMMDPMLEPYAKILQKVTFSSPKIPFVSNLTGTWITQDEAVDVNYWVQHLRSAVRCAEGLGELLEYPAQVLVEVGPGISLTSMTSQHSLRASNQIVVASTPHPQDKKPALDYLFTSLSTVWAGGCDVNWSNFNKGKKLNRVPLPTYPFAKESYWIQPGSGTDNSDVANSISHSNEANLFLPTWKRDVRWHVKKSQQIAPAEYLVFMNSEYFSESLAEKLIDDGHKVVTVKMGETFQRTGDFSYQIDPQQQDNYRQLFTELSDRGYRPTKIIHAWEITTEVENVYRNLDKGFYSLIWLTQYLSQSLSVNQTIELIVLCNTMFNVFGDEEIDPIKSTILGPINVIPQEYPNIQCKCIDIDLNCFSSDHNSNSKFVDVLSQEIGESSDLEQLVAYRNGQRWVQIIESYDAKEQSSDSTNQFKQCGVYIILGGTGGVGYQIAKFLAKKFHAKLVLVGRSIIDDDLPAIDESATLRQKKITEELINLGGEVIFCKANVSDYDQMRVVVDKAKLNFEHINGVFHIAGVLGGRLIHECSKEKCNSVLESKAIGILTLDKVMNEEQLDFLVCFSSVSAIVGGAGQVAYSAANAVLDAYAQSKNMGLARSTISINYDAWKNTGMTALGSESELSVLPDAQASMSESDLQKAANLKIAHEVLFKHAFTVEQGIAALLSILNSPSSQVIVSKRDFSSLDLVKIEQQQMELDRTTSADKDEIRRARFLEDEYVEPRNEIERVLCNIWEETLGIEQVGIADNFFELGGDSLIGLQMFSQIQKTFDVKISSAYLFDEPTVSGLAGLIAASSENREPRQEAEGSQHGELEQGEI